MSLSANGEWFIQLRLGPRDSSIIPHLKVGLKGVDGAALGHGHDPRVVHHGVHWPLPHSYR